MSLTARSAPSVICLLKVAYSPVIGPATPTLTCALAGVAANARAAAHAAAPANRVRLIMKPVPHPSNRTEGARLPCSPGGS